MSLVRAFSDCSKLRFKGFMVYIYYVTSAQIINFIAVDDKRFLGDSFVGYKRWSSFFECVILKGIVCVTTRYNKWC